MLQQQVVLFVLFGFSLAAVGGQLCTSTKSLYLLTSGSDTPGCGKNATTACLTFSYLQNQNPTWNSNTTLYTDKSVTISGAMCQWNTWKYQTCFEIRSYMKKAVVKAIFKDCSFVITKISVDFVQLELQKCSGGQIYSQNSASLTIRDSAWVNMSRNAGIMAYTNVSKFALDNCTFSDAELGSGNPAISLQGFDDVRIRGLVAYEMKVNRLVSISSTKKCAISDSVIRDNILLVGLAVDTVSSLNVTNCTFSNNNFGNSKDQGKSGTIDVFNSIVYVGNSVFERNVGINGGAVSVHPTSGSTIEIGCSLSGYNVTFSNNTARLGGALYVGSGCGLVLDGSRFHRNEASYYGGAIFIQTPNVTAGARNHTIQKDQKIEMSEFDSNGAGLAGGSLFAGCFESESIPKQPHCDNTYGSLLVESVSFSRSNLVHSISSYLYGGAVATYLDSEIRNSSFNYNRAPLGGAVFVYEATAILDSVSLVNNTAHFFGEAFYTENSELNLSNVSVFDFIINDHNIERALIGTIHQIAVIGTKLSFDQVEIKLFVENVQPLEIAVFDFEADYPHPNSPLSPPALSLENSTFTCPVNYRSVLRSIQNINSVCGESSGSVCQFNRTVSLYCRRSGISTYIPGPGSFIIEGLSEPFRYSNTSSYQVEPYHFTFSEEFPCPVPGGNCTIELKARPGYWGFHKSATSVEFKFEACPPLFCCTGEKNCLSYDSCNENRTGLLCSQCEEGFSETLLSRTCVPNESCNEAGIWVLIICFFLSLTFLVSLEIAFHWVDGLTNFVKKSWCFQALMAFLKNCVMKLKTLLGMNTTSSDSDGGEATEVLMMLLYLFQDMTMFTPNLYYCAGQKRCDFLYNMLYKVSPCRGISCHFCFGTLKNILGASLVSFIFLYLFYFVFLAWYFVFSCISSTSPMENRESPRKTEFKREQWKIHLGNYLIMYTLLIYEPLSDYTSFYLDCVTIEGKDYLREDTTQMCIGLLYTCAWIYFWVYVVCFPLYLIFGPFLLDTGRMSTKMFIAGLFFPPLLLVAWIPCFKPEEVTIVAKKIANSAELKENFRDDCYIIRAWHGWVLTFRLCLICSDVFIDEAEDKALLMFAVSFVRVGFQMWFKPYKSTVSNLFYLFTLVLLLIVALCSVCLAVLEESELQACETDLFVGKLAITIDACSLYIPGIIVALISVVVVVVLLAFCGYQCSKWCSPKKTEDQPVELRTPAEASDRNVLLQNTDNDPTYGSASNA